ncbi:hypothetical protein [Photobacterium kishitanii]|uniref:hypothetical protein n=1 Tax=Photobacterium kishitanii TaxID=318456 RepID=UPI00273958D8|nr:hypothetical protein [Photobacterium kishitanii]
MNLEKSRLKINIILTQNSDEAQYELFQRLNTGGTTLSEQEVRNCLMLMLNTDFYSVINTLKDYPNFKNCINLPTNNYDQEYHMELILRMFIGYANLVNYEKHGPISKIILSEFINQETTNLISNANIEEFENAFKKTFDKLYSVLGDNSFKKYDKYKHHFYGAFNVSVFEMITSGISANINTIVNIGDDVLKQKIIDIYNLPRGY